MELFEEPGPIAEPDAGQPAGEQVGHEVVVSSGIVQPGHVGSAAGGEALDLIESLDPVIEPGAEHPPGEGIGDERVVSGGVVQLGHVLAAGRVGVERLEAERFVRVGRAIGDGELADAGHERVVAGRVVDGDRIVTACGVDGDLFDVGGREGEAAAGGRNRVRRQLDRFVGLAAGDDKQGMGIDIDVVSRVNQILGIADLNPAIGIIDDPLNPWLGNFIDYGDYTYSRWTTYPGCITWDVWNGVGWDTVSDTIVHAIFDDETDPGTFGNIEGYALSANDARRVLLFTHDIGDDALRDRVDKVFEDSKDPKMSMK